MTAAMMAAEVGNAEFIEALRGRAVQVEARYMHRNLWLAGNTTAANSDGTFDVLYCDGTRESRVKHDMIRLNSAASQAPDALEAATRKETALKTALNLRGKVH
jgi:hypothetical protein